MLISMNYQTFETPDMDFPNKECNDAINKLNKPKEMSY